MADARTSRSNAPWGWILQAASGLLLVVLLTLHVIAQHFMGRDGLLSYREVVAYLRTPAALVLETLFSATVLYHALSGVRAILLDLGLSRAQQQRLSAWLWVLGTAAFLYGLVLTLSLALRG